MTYIGIDLGGTHTAAAYVDENGVIKKRASIPTDISGGAKTVLSGLFYVCDTLLSDANDMPLSIGIGVPGTVNDKTGEVIFTPNLPLRDINIKLEMQKKYACPVLLGNDANCAALGETVAGGAKGARNVVLITLGTGVGGGILFGGRLHTGLSGAAGELGHMVIRAGGRPCGCGRRGCWESYASATGLIRTAKEFMRIYKESMILSICGGNPENVSGRIVFEAYRLGDKAARRIVERYTKNLATGIVNIINMLEPELICIGGGISNEWDCFAEQLQAKVDKEKFTRFAPESNQTRIVRAELGNDAGIIGAALLGKRRETGAAPVDGYNA